MEISPSLIICFFLKDDTKVVRQFWAKQAFNKWVNPVKLGAYTQSDMHGNIVRKTIISKIFVTVS